MAAFLFAKIIIASMKFGFLNGMDMINFIQNQTRVFRLYKPKDQQKPLCPQTQLKKRFYGFDRINDMLIYR